MGPAKRSYVHASVYDRSIVETQLIRVMHDLVSPTIAAGIIGHNCTVRKVNRWIQRMKNGETVDDLLNSKCGKRSEKKSRDMKDSVQESSIEADTATDSSEKVESSNEEYDFEVNGFHIRDQVLNSHLQRNRNVIHLVAKDGSFYEYLISKADRKKSRNYYVCSGCKTVKDEMRRAAAPKEDLPKIPSLTYYYGIGDGRFTQRMTPHVEQCRQPLQHYQWIAMNESREAKLMVKNKVKQSKQAWVDACVAVKRAAIKQDLAVRGPGSVSEEMGEWPQKAYQRFARRKADGTIADSIKNAFNDYGDLENNLMGESKLALMTADEHLNGSTGQSPVPDAVPTASPKQGTTQVNKIATKLTPDSPQVKEAVDKIIGLGLDVTRTTACDTILKNVIGDDIEVALSKTVNQLLAANDKPTSSDKGAFSDLNPKPKEDKKPDVIEISENDAALSKAIENSMQDDLQKALELSLTQQAKPVVPSDRWMLEECIKNPHHRKLEAGNLVGLRNIGAVCWLNSVVQTLFHMSQFRKLIFDFDVDSCRRKLSTRTGIVNSQEDLSLFAVNLVGALRRVFSKLLGSQRKYVDAFLVVNLIRKEQNSFKISESDSFVDQRQQDVGEFLHVLLSWLEEAFRVQHSLSMDENSMESNAIIELFYGKLLPVVGDAAKEHEHFSLWSLPACHSNLHDAIEASLISADSNTIKWIEHTPPFLTFILSRFNYNRKTNQVDKINSPMKFPRKLCLDRYLKENHEFTTSKREQVLKMKEKLTSLRQKLKGYVQYECGTFHGPLTNMFSCVIDYTIKGGLHDATATGTDVPMDSPSSSHSAPDVLGESAMEVDSVVHATNPMALRVEVGDGPVISNEQEKKTVVDYLNRLLTQLKNSINNLEKEMNLLEKEIEGAYGEVPNTVCSYDLHAVLVHEGQAGGGHYWSLIQDSHGQWRKFNDTHVTPSDWDTVSLESFGEIVPNTSAYCLVYIQNNRAENEVDLVKSVAHELLPQDLFKDVLKDNKKFEVELFEHDRCESCSIQSAGGCLQIGLMGYELNIKDRPVDCSIYETTSKYVLTILIDLVSNWSPDVPWIASHALLTLPDRVRDDLWTKVGPIVDYELMRRDVVPVPVSDCRVTNLLAWLMCSTTKIEYENESSLWRLHLMAALSAAMPNLELEQNIAMRVREVIQLNTERQVALKNETLNAQLKDDLVLYHIFRCNIVLLVTATKEFNTNPIKALQLCQVAIEHNEQILLAHNMSVAQCGYFRNLCNIFRISLVTLTKMKSEVFLKAEDAEALIIENEFKKLPWKKVCYVMGKKTSDVDKAVLNYVQQTWCTLLSHSGLSEKKKQILNDLILFHLLETSAGLPDHGCKANVTIRNIEADVVNLISACDQHKLVNDEQLMHIIAPHVKQ